MQFNNRLDLFCIKKITLQYSQWKVIPKLRSINTTVCNHDRKTSRKHKWHKKLHNLPFQILHVPVLYCLQLSKELHELKSLSCVHHCHFKCCSMSESLWPRNLLFIWEWYYLFFRNIPSVICIINVFKCVGEILYKWNQLEESYPNYRVQDLSLPLYLHYVKHSITFSNTISKSLTHINLAHVK